MSPAPPAFQFYFRDFDFATGNMTNEQVGAYIRLLGYAWDRGGIPTDLEQQALIIRGTQADVERLWPALQSKWQRQGTELVNPRMEEIRAKRQAYTEQAQENGKRGGRPKSQSQTKTDSVSEKEPKAEPKQNLSRAGEWSKETGDEVVEETEPARAILDWFNATAETRYTSERFLVPIRKRIAEHPDLTLGDHQAIIHRNFQDPWWKGAPSPSVIYGSQEQFERAIHHGTKTSKPSPKRSAEAQARIDAWSKPQAAA